MRLADFVGQAAAAHPSLQAAVEALPALPPDARHCLLSGPERSGKTSLLFHAALSMARQGKSVLLLCRRTKLEQTPPLLPYGVQHTDPAWQRVTIKYLTNGYELLRYASHMHVLESPPDVLMVDDLHMLADLPSGDRPRPRDMALCRILAALHEAVEEASRLKGRPCELIVSESSHADGPRLLYILQRWLPLVLHIRLAGQSNILSVLNPLPNIPPPCLAHLHFSLKHDALILDSLQHPPNC